MRTHGLLLTRALYRSASQNHRRGCWIVDYITNIGHTPLESRCRHVLGSAITDLVILGRVRDTLNPSGGFTGSETTGGFVAMVGTPASAMDFQWTRVSDRRRLKYQKVREATFLISTRIY